MNVCFDRSYMISSYIDTELINRFMAIEQLFFSFLKKKAYQH